jgi:polysaccharide biosynthesis protein PslH
VKNELKGAALYSALLKNVFSREPFSVQKHYHASFAEEMKRLLGECKFDLIHCEWTPYARYCNEAQDIPVVIATHNIEADILRRRAESSGMGARTFFAVQAERMSRFERAVLGRASVAAAVSENDATWMHHNGVSEPVVVPNGVDLDYFCAEEQSHSQEVLFLGSLDWHANVDAIEYFLAESWPLIHRAKPGARFRIVGRRPNAALERLVASQRSVELVGEVPDVRPYLESAAVVVVPLRIGGGSRIKILEALASGRAVVSTTVGAEGLNLCDGREIAIQDDAEKFAAATISLLDSPQSRSELANAGRARVQAEYSWERCAERLEQAWQRAAEKRLSLLEAAVSA